VRLPRSASLRVGRLLGKDTFDEHLRSMCIVDVPIYLINLLMIIQFLLISHALQYQASSTNSCLCGRASNLASIIIIVNEKENEE
jgi:hypothetical protein